MSWTVADVMTRDVVVVGPDEDFKSCARLLHVHEISALPVVDHEGRLIGIGSEADLLAKERDRDAKPPLLGIHWDEDDGRPAGRTAGDLMTHPAISISPDASIPRAVRLMYREAVKHLPVVDATGAMVGIVSRADPLKTFTRNDESIERDIVDDVIRKALALDYKKVGVTSSTVLFGLLRIAT
jgi:CBS domain-containing protein